MASGSGRNWGGQTWNAWQGEYVDRREENARRRSTPAHEAKDNRTKKRLEELQARQSELAAAQAGCGKRIRRKEKERAGRTIHMPGRPGHSSARRGGVTGRRETLYIIGIESPARRQRRPAQLLQRWGGSHA